MKIDTNRWMWVRKPKQYKITKNEIKIVTEPHTDLWKELTIILEMIMHQSYRWKQMKNISVLW